MHSLFYILYSPLKILLRNIVGEVFESSDRKAWAMVETQSQKKITNKTKSFHFRYLELCRSKNYAALSDVKAKNNNTTILEFFGDKLKIEDWLLIIDALYNDVALHSMAIRLRRTCNMGKYGFKGRSFDCGSVLTFAGLLSGLVSVLEGVDTERKARMYKNKPVVFTKFIFSGLVEAISNCIKNNKNLTSVSFEGLPLVERYVVNISKVSRFLQFPCYFLCNSLRTGNFWCVILDVVLCGK